MYAGPAMVSQQMPPFSSVLSACPLLLPLDRPQAHVGGHSWQARRITSQKGTQPKVNTQSWSYKLREFFKPSLTDPSPQKRPATRFSRDHRTLSNSEWQRLGIHNSVRIFMRFHQIVPDLVPKAFTPEINLIVAYGETSWDLVYRGNFLSALQLLAPPNVTIPADGLDPAAHYSLLFIGLDEPHRGHKGGKNRLYWFVKDIPGSAPEVAAGQTIIPYSPPLPIKNSGEHRYAFALVEQKNGRERDLSTINLKPNAFSASSFLRQNRLLVKGLCFFQSEYDPELSKVWEELGEPEPLLETQAHVKTRVYERLRVEEISSYTKHQEPS